MVKFGPAIIDIKTTGGDAASASFESLRYVLDPREFGGDSAKTLVDFLNSCLSGPRDRSDLFRLESFANSTRGTLELVSIKILPSDRFLELVSAVASEREDVSLGFLHGWPILSLVGDTASMAEAGASSSRLGGGLTQ